MTCVVARFTFFLNPAHDMMGGRRQGGREGVISGGSERRGCFASRSCGKDGQFGYLVKQSERIGDE